LEINIVVLRFHTNNAYSEIPENFDVSREKDHSVMRYRDDYIYPWLPPSPPKRLYLIYDEVPRAVVLYSRAQVGFALIGSNTSLMNKRFDNKHPCKLAVRSMVDSKRFVTLTPAYISKVNQFTDITGE
jgi:hypothetical protein